MIARLSLLLALVLYTIPAFADSGLRHDLYVSLEPDTRRISVHDRVTLTAPADATHVSFILPSSFIATGTQVAGTSVATQRKGTRWLVPVAGAGPHTVQFSYTAQLPSLSKGGGVGLDNKGGFLPSGWYPQMEGLLNETISTLSN